MKAKASLISTIMGYAVAVCQAWLNIDWSKFDPTLAWLTKEAPILFLSAVIALGGHMTKINFSEKN